MRKICEHFDKSIEPPKNPQLPSQDKNYTTGLNLGKLY
jgi:hypothetical protein